MSAGLPVVATSVGDVPHIVANGTGFVVPPRDPVAFASKLQVLLDNPAQIHMYGKAAQDYVSSSYNAIAWLDRLMQVYVEVCNCSGLVHKTT
jgi:glycosyltransferase involved in cell wall biosynthesis